MNRMKKAMMAVVGVGLCAVFATSCTMVSVNTDKDRSQVVAEVNGTQLKKGEVMDQVDMMLQMYGMTRDQYVQQQGAEQFASMKEGMLDQAVKNELLYQHAKADGLADESDQAKEEKRKSIEDTLDSLRKSIEEQAAGDDTITDKDKYIEETFAEYSKMYGYDDIDYAVEQAMKTDAIMAETEKINNEVSYTDADAQKEYDNLLAAQQSAIDEDPTAYNTYKSSSTVVYEPANSKYVKNLLIALPEDVQNEIKTKRQSGDDAGADELLKTELAKIKADADKALERAKAGEDFNALMEELGGDSGMKSEPAKTKGYLVFKGSGMVEPFETASLAMTTPGEISDLVPTDFGYHIIQYVSEGGGQIPFEEVKDKLVGSGLTAAQNKHLDETLEQWKGAEDIKTYVDRLSTFA